MASFSVYIVRVPRWKRRDVEPERNDPWGPCTPPPSLETFSTNITVSTRSSIEITGLLKKKKKMKKMKK